MKKHFLAIALSLLTLAVSTPALGQSSTEGREFWVALTLCAAPSTGLPEPFIAVSTKQTTTITITNPNEPTWPGVTRQVRGGVWTEFTVQDIALSHWYPQNANSIDNAFAQNNQINNYGLKVTTDADVSVYAALRMEHSFDAANVLPAHVLTTDYYTQDYPPYIKPSDGKALSMFTIVATQPNTTVTITPTSAIGNHPAGQPYTVTLNAGQTYYGIGNTLQTLSGTHIVSADNKAIAVFQGNVFTQIPGGKSARDCTYEQAMPTDYWGSQFVITRSLQKDANRIRVTAMNDGTQLRISGRIVSTINTGETYEFEISNNDWSSSVINAVHNAGREMPDIYTGEAVYLQSSCPVAVYSYDVSSQYVANTTEEYNEYGDPSMVWISPLEQRINDITFGTCGTDKTKRHFIDIVCLTDDADKTVISSTMRANIPHTYTPCPGNPQYSYARVFLVDDAAGLGESVFNIKNPNGVIAHVYGNGDNESYAYSVGSSAVKRGIRINGNNFTDGYIYPEQFCLNDLLDFDAQVGSDIITAVDWDFGDGITELNGDIQTQHQYLTPGWFDASARVRAQKACSEETYPVETIHFSFYINLPDTVGRRDSVCAGEPWPYDGKIYDHDTTIIYDDGQCDTIYRYALHVGQPSPQTTLNIIARDSFVYEGKSYFTSQQLTFNYLNSDKCDSTVVINLTVHTSLDLTVSNAVFDCNNSTTMLLPYTIHKGDGGQMDNLLYHHQGAARTITKDGANFYLDIAGIDPGTYVDTLTVHDNLVDSLIVLPFVAEIYYPSSIFAYKYNNVLAVYQNKGYTFTAYQWYIDNMPVIGANKSVYHQPAEDPFNGESAYVVLSRYDANGQVVTARSCEQMLPYKDVEPSRPAVFNTSKRLIQDHIYVFREEGIYDAYGRRIR